MRANNNVLVKAPAQPINTYIMYACNQKVKIKIHAYMFPFLLCSDENLHRVDATTSASLSAFDL